MAADDHSNLRREIVDRPGDMDARAVYADALAERGDSHGEYVHLALAASKEPYGSTARRELGRRAAELARRHGARWEAPISERWERLAETPELVRLCLRYESGFADDLTVHRAEALPAVAAIVEGEVPVRRLTVEFPWVERAELVVRCRELRGLRSLRLQHMNRAGGHALKVLLASDELEELEELEIHGSITPEVCDVLGSSLGARRLTSLRLVAAEHAEVNPERLPALLSSPACRHLERVEIAARSNDDVALAIAGLERITHVAIDGGRLTKKPIEALAKRAGLRALRLARCELGIAALCKLASSPHLGALEWLDIGGKNGLNGTKLPKLLGALALPKLRRLGLSSSSLRIEGARALVAMADRLAAVEELDLGENFLRSEGVEELARGSFAGLRVLSLYDNHLGRDGVSRLGQGSVLSGVEELDLGRNLWNEKGPVEPFRACGRMRKLRLRGTQCFDSRLEALVGTMPSLEVLETDQRREAVALLASGKLPHLRALRAQLSAEQCIELAEIPNARSLELVTCGYFTATPQAARALLESTALERLSRVYTHSPDELDPGLRAALRVRFGVAADWSLETPETDPLRAAGAWIPYRGV